VIGTDVALAASLLKEGKLVGIPTETVYGLGANALDSKAIASIYAVKNRPIFNPLILHFASWEAAQPYLKEVPQEITRLASKFCPGSISFLLQKTDLVLDIVTAGSSHVVVRVPDHPVTLKLLSLLDFPLAAPSANISNTVSPTSAQHVEQSIGKDISYILDGGSSTVGLESTIIEWVNGEIIILREGGISREMLKTNTNVEVKSYEGNKISTPGQLNKHYATNKPLIIVKDLNKYLLKSQTDCTVLAFDESIAADNCIYLSRSYNLNEIASNLFAAMRQADKHFTTHIVVAEIREEGIGRAIADRLRRASMS
jgi:L-threonylcarbamoyladenylate synthase